MAIQNAVQVTIILLGDGVSKVFKFDLEKDSFILNNFGTINWDKKISPVDVQPVADSSFSASLNGTLVSLTYAMAPSGIVGASIYVLFPGE